MTRLANSIHTIAFDADDTLWCNENFYLEATERFYAIVRRYCDETLIAEAFAQREARNMDELGYGAKAMTISMVETALSLCPDIPHDALHAIIEAGRALLRIPTVMLPNVVETLTALQSRFQILILTKGETKEQQRKFDNSPLPKNIPYIILPDKCAETYRRIFDRFAMDPSKFLMVGNSPRSDILPPLQLGAYACYIPYHTTWAHEDLPLPEHPRLIRLSNISELNSILA